MNDGERLDLNPQGPPETVLDPPPTEASHALEQALERPEDERRQAVAEVVARWPRYVDAWAWLGELSAGLSAYAYFRVGYHRGLDALRGAGWRGSGYVRWSHEDNRGFLRAVDGLRRMAAEIGETDEEERCADFLVQLDPEWNRDPDG